MKYFLYGLCILLIGLKLAGVISASWWMVTLPIWGYVVFLAVVIVASLAISIWINIK